MGNTGKQGNPGFPLTLPIMKDNERPLLTLPIMKGGGWGERSSPDCYIIYYIYIIY